LFFSNFHKFAPIIRLDSLVFFTALPNILVQLLQFEADYVDFVVQVVNDLRFFLQALCDAVRICEHQLFDGAAEKLFSSHVHGIVEDAVFPVHLQNVHSEVNLLDQRFEEGNVDQICVILCAESHHFLESVEFFQVSNAVWIQVALARLGINDELIIDIAVQKRLNLVHALKLLLHLSVELDEVDVNEIVWILKELFLFDNDFLAYFLEPVEGSHGNALAVFASENVRLFVGVEIVHKLYGIQNQRHQQVKRAEAHEFGHVSELLACGCGGRGVKNLKQHANKLIQE
jgi:hypothetical protein